MSENENTGSEQPAAESPAGAASLLAKFSTAEQFIGLGVLLILLVSDLIGSILTDRYSVHDYTFLAAAVTLALLIVVKVRGSEPPVPYGWLLKTASLVVVIAGVRQFLGDIEADGYLGSRNILFAIVLYAGVGLVAYGGYQLRD